MEPTKIALFGLGRAGQFHLRSIALGENMVLDSVYDVDAEKCQATAKRWGARACQSVEEALQGVDAAIVATPTVTHTDLALAAMGAGKAVLCEKPLGLSEKEIVKCYKFAEEHNVPLMTAFQRRFDPSFAKLQAQVQAGDIGDVMTLRSVSRDCPIPSVAFLRHSCGMFHDCLSHDIDMVRFVANREVEWVSVATHTWDPEIAKLDDVDTIIATLGLEGGVLANIEVTRHGASFGYDQRFEVLGRKGLLEVANQIPTSTVQYSSDAVTQGPIHYSFPTRYADAYRLELQSFVDNLRAGKSVPVVEKDVMATFRIASCCELSHQQNGARVPVPKS